MLYPLAFHIPFMDQSAVLLVIAFLIFGKRLPEMGRSLGKGIVEFKRGIKGLEDDMEVAASVPTPIATPAIQSTPQPAFKFDPHTGERIQAPVPPAARFDPYTGKPLPAGSLPTVVDAEVVDGVHAPA